jgi:hypothetical protein
MADVPASSQHRIIRYVMRENRGRMQRYRVGGSHQRARYSDELVERIMSLHDEGCGWIRIWKQLTREGVQINRWTVQAICRGRIRAQLGYEAPDGGG